MGTTDDTLSSGSFNLILHAARQHGADSLELCKTVGVDPAVLQDPDGRVPIRAVQALWHEAIRQTGEPDLPLQLGELINTLSLGVLAYVMMHCPNLGKAIEKLCQYQDIACEGVLTTGQVVGERFFISLKLTSSAIVYPDYTLTSEFSVYQSAFRALIGLPVAAEEIRFGFPEPSNRAAYERVFGATKLVFDAAETVMILDAEWLGKPVMNANPGLFPLFEQHARELLLKLRQPDLSFRVKQEIIALLKGEEPTLALVADRLAMGVRTLQLHLKETGVTYQQLLDDVRRNLAIQHLREPYFSTTDIAYLLGFSEPSVFYRTFKKWTGSTPGAYRQQTIAAGRA
ncbi:AraC family transcriptional regulator [Larkinella terrae]|uniref:Helix-turn-helix domain-containing protein n=1 Tax=Larkinella terrae TaxID=2025311 RepID=A0A7K0EME6_9BACT|nr:AraC family transcriptional regulator [Larkinella terrae]MRS63007.1 helix-turn-helix domain-containing protein [Larkinella terrae]